MDVEINHHRLGQDFGLHIRHRGLAESHIQGSLLISIDRQVHIPDLTTTLVTQVQPYLLPIQGG